MTYNLYPIVSRLAGILLLVSGSLKVQELVSKPLLVPPSWGSTALAGFELLFGAWLLIVLYPRWSRLIALACFIGFFNIALIAAIKGLPSCGCFGAIPVRPWIAVALDGSMIVALFFCLPRHEPTSALRARRVRLTLLGLAAVSVLCLIGWRVGVAFNFWQTVVPSRPDAELTAGADAPTLELILNGLERNHAAFSTYECTLEKTSTEYFVKSKWAPTRIIPKGMTADQLPQESVQRIVDKTLVRGEELKSDCSVSQKGSDVRGILVWSKGKRIQYAPNLRQAWIMKAVALDIGLGASVDLRCAGLRPHFRSIADWLRQCEVQGSRVLRDPSGDIVVRLHVIAPPSMWKDKDDVTIDFARSRNYLPIRVVYRYHPTGGIAESTKIEYQKVDSVEAWFPKTITTRDFFRDTTSDPEATTGCNILSVAEVRVNSVGGGVNDEEFDPLLPPKTRLLGNLAAKARTGGEPVRASSVTRKIPLELTRQPLQSRATTIPWQWPVGVDSVLAMLGLIFRKRLIL